MMIRQPACGSHQTDQGAQLCPQCGSARIVVDAKRGLGLIAGCSVVDGRPTSQSLPARTMVAIVELDMGP